jgi:hypothetical protein
MTIDGKLQDVIKEVMKRERIGYPPTDKRNPERTIKEALTAIKSVLLKEVNSLPGRGDYDYSDYHPKIYKKDIEEMLK